MQKEVLLKVDELRTEFFSSKKSSVTAVDKVSFDIYKGEILGLVGESGCGKSVTSLSIMRLLKDTPGKVTHGHAILDGMDRISDSVSLACSVIGFVLMLAALWVQFGPKDKDFGKRP